MASFSTSDALASGFRLIGKRPLSVIAWGLVYLVIFVGPVALMLHSVGPALLGFLQAAAEAARSGAHHEPDRQQMMAFVTQMGLFRPVLFLAGLVSQTLVMGAIFRAVLEPRNRGFFGLRLGAKELWLALTSFVLAVLLVIFMIVICAALALVCALIVMGLRAAGAPEGLMAIPIALAVIGGLVAFVWIAVRFSLTLPMTFADGQFRLFESWALTRGHAGQLFVMGFVLVIVLMVVGVVAQGIVAGVLLGGGFSMAHHLEDFEAFLRQTPQQIVATVGPLLAVVVVLLCIVRAALMAIFLAPWAEVYRELTAPTDA